MTKKNVLFVGSFAKDVEAANIGGQMYASTTLVNSELSKKVRWFLVDSTARTNKKRTKVERIIGSLKRMVRFLYYLTSKEIHSVLLFCSNGLSFKEKAYMARIARKFGKKVILAPRSGLIKNDIESNTSFKNFVVETLGKVDVLLCQGPSWKKYYKALNQNSDLEFKIIHNWIKLDQYVQLEHKIESDSITVLFLGWVTRNKGIYEIIEVAKQLKNENIVFLIAGNGDAFDDVSSIIDKEGLSDIMKLLGWVDGPKKMDLLEKSDVFILPSHREGYPNSLIEAMASSTAVISTKVGSIPDLISDKKNGLLITPKNTAELKDSILLLKQDKELRQNLAKSARKTVIKQNNVNDAIKSFESILG